jgi:hypothetical protein
VRELVFLERAPVRRDDEKKNEFLVFEDGPSVDVTLQWATYRDASDQTSLSRIWGGIHPPVDDIPGRVIGEKIGADAFGLAERYFEGSVSTAIVIASFDATLAEEGITLRWTIAADEAVAGFHIYRVDGNEGGEQLLTGEPLDASARSYTDTTARPGGRYRYTLAITHAGSGSVRSAPIEIAWAPLKVHLAQNHPNPFNPRTTIQYTLPQQSHVKLGIYSAAGRLVRTLVNAPLSPGVRQITWDGTNDAGHPVASGAYFYRLEAASTAVVKKMMLLK